MTTTSACVRVERELSESYPIGDITQGCVISPWLFNIFMDRCMRVKGENVGTSLKINVMGWTVMACLFATNIVLFAESEEQLQNVVD